MSQGLLATIVCLTSNAPKSFVRMEKFKLFTTSITLLCLQCEPANVMLVHGEASKMEFLKQKIQQEFGRTFL